MTRTSLLGTVMLGLSLAVFTGCGGGDLPELGTVHGKVTLDGKPVVGARVVFQPEEGRPSTGVTDAEGNYELYYTVDVKGAIVGRHTVRIYSGDAGGEEEAEEPAPASDANAPPPTKIPEKYGDNSTLSFEVKSGDNTIDIELTSQ